MFGCSGYSQLSGVSADMLNCTGVVVATELGELRHLELGRWRQLIVDFWIWLGVRDDAPLRGDPKLVPQDLSQLILKASCPCAIGLVGLVMRNRPCFVLALPSQ